MLKNGVVKILLSFTLIIGGLSITSIGGKTAEAASSTSYPAYKSMSKSSLPTSYKLYYTNKDRSLGIYLGSIAVGAIGLIPGAGWGSFLVSVGLGGWELAKGYSSYKVYLERSPISGKIGRSKTIFYKDKNFKGSTKTVYEDWD